MTQHTTLSLHTGAAQPWRRSATPAVIAGFVLCLLVTTIHGSPSPTRRRVIKPNVSNATVAFNNSVVAAAPEIPVAATSLETCTEGECVSSANKTGSEELLPPAKASVTSGDPLVRTNHIGLARYAAGSIADEIQERVQADIRRRQERSNATTTTTPQPPSTFQERLRRLSAAVNRNVDSRFREMSSSRDVDRLKDINSTPVMEVHATQTDPSESEAKGEIWLIPAGSHAEETPELPDTYSKVAGFISTMSYDETVKPSTYSTSSVKFTEDGTSKGFISTSRFSYSESVTPAIKPTSVTLVLTTSGSYDHSDSGSTRDDDDDDEENKQATSEVASTTDDKEAETLEQTVTAAADKESEVSEQSTTNTSEEEPVHNNTIVQNNDSVTSFTTTLFNTTRANETEDLQNDTKISSSTTTSTTMAPSDKKVDLQSNKNLTDIEDMLNINKTEISSKLSLKENQSKKENESTVKNVTVLDLDESMASQVVTVATVPSTSPRRRYRPSTLATPTQSTTQESPVVTWRGSTKYFSESSTLSAAASTLVTVRTTPDGTASTPAITTYRGRERTTQPAWTRLKQVTTTTPPPDTQGEESTLECTTTEESSSETTLSPLDDEGGSTVVYRTSSSVRTTSRTTPRRTTSTTPTIPSSTEDTTRLSGTTVTETWTSVNTSECSEENSTTLEPGTTLTPEDDTTTASSSGDISSSVEDIVFNSTAIPETNTIDDGEVATTGVPSSVKAFLKITVATSWEELCRDQEQFRQGVASLLARGTGRTVSSDRVVLLNDDQCLEPPDAPPEGIPLHVYLADDQGRYDMQLTEAFPQIWGRDQDNELQITCVDVRYTKDEQAGPAVQESANVIAAIAISGVAAGCLLLLVILMLIMRKRQTRTTYGQRCTPVSLDAYSLDSVSVYNSVRRKGHLRASKRSYGNPAFDDPDSPTHPVNFAGLANCVGDAAALHAEFSLVPVVPARMDDLPPGAEHKNRYANVIPLPETRVPLTRRGSDPLTEYINANFVRGPKNAPKYYIACQAPLESTVADFWRMIWEQQSKVLLMLTDLEENGAEKCADYLPPSEVLDCHRRFGDFHVTLKKREVRDKYVVSTLQLKNMETSLWREVTHLWFFGWPATGVPEEPSAVIAFIIEARAFMKANSGPTVVHCSPGTGRTGTVLACDLCIREFEQSRLVDVPRVVSRLRRDRAGAVQTREQYVFIYQVLNLYAAKLTGGAMDSF